MNNLYEAFYGSIVINTCLFVHFLAVNCAFEHTGSKATTNDLTSVRIIHSY